MICDEKVIIKTQKKILDSSRQTRKWLLDMDWLQTRQGKSSANEGKYSTGWHTMQELADHYKIGNSIFDVVKIKTWGTHNA